MAGVRTITLCPSFVTSLMFTLISLSSEHPQPVRAVFGRTTVFEKFCEFTFLSPKSIKTSFCAVVIVSALWCLTAIRWCTQQSFIMSKILLIILVKRQNLAQTKKNIEEGQSFSTPKTVAKPKTKRSMKIQENEVKRESIEMSLTQDYLDPIRGNKQRGISPIKLSGYDLAVIWSRKNEPELYKNVEAKPDRMSNRAINYILPNLQLLTFLMSNFSEHYQNKIWNSGYFRFLLENYLGTAEYSKKKLSQEEKKARLKSAMQWLMDSLTIIESSLPNSFRDSLRESSRVYFKLIKAIAENEGIEEIKIHDKMLS